MRLICPNCDAQYEVDASAIPPAGRDVQCSNCGHAWFQEPVDTAQAEFFAPEPDIDEDALDAALSQDDQGQDTPPATASQPQRRTVDENVLAVLREEAEREAIARRAEASTLEMQGDLGLPPPVHAAPPPPPPSAAPDRPDDPDQPDDPNDPDEPDGHVTPARAPAPPSDTERRLAAIKGQPVAPPTPLARRDLLPDIEEINSSLSPSTAEARQSYDDVDALPDLIGRSSRRSGFRSGFVLMLVLAGIGTALYLMAPQVADQFPQAADAMTAYVAAVDAARFWLDGLIRQATGALNGLTGNGGA